MNGERFVEGKIPFCNRTERVRALPRLQCHIGIHVDIAVLYL